jgi:hypothetical protein
LRAIGRPLPRIFFDGNLGDSERGHPLIYDQSKVDLDAIEGGPQEGMLIELYTPEELECTAILKRGMLWEADVWLAVPIEPLRLL